MSDVAIFAVGSVVFVITSWATIAYGLAAVHQMRVRDVNESPTVGLRTATQFTDVYVTTTPEPDPAVVDRA
ncbi:MAG TPA: hypothetical protein VLG28_16615 [Acidimicrobiia bacterium]|jgi:hypothetical protein|nr:hypothetical protein [Acidimicrobiia bacterium]